MQVNWKKIEPKDAKDELLAIALMQGASLPFPDLTKGVKKEAFEGKSGQVYSVDTLGKYGFRKLLLYGLGEEKEFNLDFIRRFAGCAVRYARGLKSDSVGIALPKVPKLHPTDAAGAIAEAAILANYQCTKFKSKKEEDKDDSFEVKEATIFSAEDSTDFVRKASILAYSQNFVRDINENPANIATPSMLAQTARDLAKENKLTATVFEKEDLKKMKMNAILAVNQGSVLPPVLVILEYNKEKKNLPLYAVVGKGITFDSGGISLKPAKGMQEMKYDKTGAVTVMGIIKAASELQLPVRLIAAFAATENMPGGSAQKPGDIITAYSGKTIEVLNTDAEGRLILADAVAYVAERKPDALISIATLTGAVVIALGRHRMGLVGNDDGVMRTLEEAGERTFERVWRLPYDKEYREMNKGEFADIKNIGSETGDAGTVTAASFIGEFVGDCKWAHLDIAAVDAIVDKHGYLEKGASGIGVRLVCEALERMVKK